MEVGSNRTRSLAIAFRQTKERVVAAPYNRATNASYTLADGKTCWPRITRTLPAAPSATNSPSLPI